MKSNPLFGFLPRRLVGVFGVALLSAVVVLTVWGRVDWASSVLGTATVSVALLPIAIGAALRDIIPGT